MACLIMLGVTDDSGDDSDIVQGLASVLPKLVKLRWLDITDVYLDESGKTVIDNIESTHLRVLILENTFLLLSGSAFVKLLSRLPSLGYLSLFDTGLTKAELTQILQVLPTSCPNLLYLDVGGVSFTNAELKPVFLLNKLRGLGFGANIVDDLFEAIKNIHVCKTLQFLYLMFNMAISHRQDEFISEVTSLPRLRFLVVSKSDLDSEGEQNVRNVLKQKGGRFVNSKTDPHGWDEYKGQLDILRDECYNAT